MVRRLMGILALLTAATTSRAEAQSFEAVGVRAQGMGGAFVAVADDASAVYWNPGAMAAVGLFSAAAEWGEGDLARTGFDADGRPVDGSLALRRQSGALVAFGVPPLGVAYYRLRATGFSGSLAADAPAGRGAELTTDNVAVNLLQSLADGIHVGASVRLVHGQAASGFVSGQDASALADAAGDLPGRGGWDVDVDAGLLIDRGVWRAGVTARNLATASFLAPGGEELALDRQVRVGAAFVPRSGTTLAVDADLTRTTTETGDVRRLAVGLEQAVVPRLTLRGGFHVNTVDEARPAAAFGASVAVRSSMWVDVQATIGAHDAERRWGVGVRMGL